MPSHSFAAALLAGAVFVLGDHAPAQGGVFRGHEPMSWKPFRAPTGSGPVPEVRPVPRGPEPPVGGLRGPGARLEPDLDTWDYWWEFNKDTYLGRVDPLVHAESTRARPGGFSPAVAQTLASSRSWMIRQACLVAMAKSRDDLSDQPLVDALSAELHNDDHGMRDTAALALGIAGRLDNGTLDRLIGVALGDERGRIACGRPVDARTRSFACYALGLLAEGKHQIAVDRAVLGAMTTILGDATSSNRDLQVAAIHAIGLLDPGDATPAAAELQRLAARCLLERYDRAGGMGEKLVQAHCPTAMAKLFRRGAAAAAPYVARFANDLRGSTTNHGGHPDIDRSCAIALGALCSPPELGDAACSELLGVVRATHRDPQTRGFATIALGQIGGNRNRALLIAQLGGGNTKSQAWCALALGVLAHDTYAAQEQRGEPFAPDRAIGQPLIDLLESSQDEQLVSALAIALGLARDDDAAPVMAALLRNELRKDDQAGCLCLGLAMIGGDGAVDDVLTAWHAAVRRPDLLRCSATALGLVGGQRTIEPLLGRFTEARWPPRAQCAMATALARSADDRAVAELERLLVDKDHSDVARAFAAVALGCIADRAASPWHVRLAANVNYRAATVTLTDGMSGVLDQP